MSDSGFQPDLSILQDPQKRLWPELSDVPDEFVLYGGTAVALRLGHRMSVDFDFFVSGSIDTDLIYRSIPFLRQAKVLQSQPNTLTCRVDRSGAVQISFFGVPSLRMIRSPDRTIDNGLKIASLIDLAGMKAAVVQKRAEAKDYRDLDAMFESGRIDLPMALSAGCMIYGASFEPQNTLKALSYFGDGDLMTLEDDIRCRLVSAVEQVDLDSLPCLDRKMDLP